MKQHFCPAEQSMIAFEKECNWCGELESQEPVAWMHIMDNTEGIKANGAGIVSITQKRKHPFGKVGIDFSKSYPVTSTPLYTNPPQRKPLEVDKDGWFWLNKNECIHVDLVRKIEAAHGIKEKNS